jgi:hypothetical protein
VTYPFGDQTPSTDVRGLRLAALHLASHALDNGPTALPEPEATESGLLVAAIPTAEQKFTDVLMGAARYMEFIDKQGSVSAHTVALEEIRDMITGPSSMLAGDSLLRLRSVVNAALGLGR